MDGRASVIGRSEAVRLMAPAWYAYAASAHLSPLHDEVVDHHCDQVDTDRAVTPSLLRDEKLRAHAVGARDEDWVVVPGELAVEKATKAADRALGQTDASR